MNTKRNAARESAAIYRTKMKKLGFRQVNIWVPDTRSPNFRKECRRQSRLAAAADKSGRIDSLLNGATGSMEPFVGYASFERTTSTNPSAASR